MSFTGSSARSNAATRGKPMLDLSISYEAIPKLAKGALLTLELTVVILFLAAIFALPLAFALNSSRRWLSRLTAGYIMFFRGTPALIQIFLVYYGSGQFVAIRESFLWPFLREPYWCAVMALSLNGAAYTGNILAGAMRGVSPGTVEAGKALGLSWFQVQRLIVIPQAVRIGFPAYTNEVIQTLKATSLASTVTLIELTGAAQVIVNDTFAPYEVFISAGLMYLAMTYTLTWLFEHIEKRLYADQHEAEAAHRLQRAVEV